MKKQFDANNEHGSIAGTRRRAIMVAHGRNTVGVLAVALILAGGCANGSKQRITMLEQTNRDLSSRLNQLRSQLDTTAQARSDLDRQLLAAQGEIDALNRQLAEAPEVQQPAPGWTDTPSGAMIAIDSSVLFAPGKDTLRPEAQRTLDGIVSTLEGEYRDKDIIVFGHTDNQPIRKSGWEDNWQLSTERALAVVRYLQAKGVDTARMAAAGCGEYRPRAANDSAASRAQNRRVSIFVVDANLALGRPTP